MAITVGEVIAEARVRLADDYDNTKTWSDTTLTRFLNAGVRQIIDVKPNSNVAGAKLDVDEAEYKKNRYLTIPPNGKYLVDVSCVEMGDQPTSPVIGATLIDRKDLERINPKWLEFNHIQTDNMIIPISIQGQSTEQKEKQKENRINYAFDNDDPSIFYIYPNYIVDSGQYSKLCIRYQQFPETVNKITDNIPTSMEKYVASLYKWITYEAYLVNSSSVSYMQRARTIYQDFFETLGVRTKTEMFSDPNIGLMEQTSKQEYNPRSR